QLPAFKTLMQKTEQAYKNQQWSEAERYALQAQRLAPQAAETYLFLALTANHKQQYSNAESLARRGLSFAQSQAMKKQLWLVILKAGQQRNNPKTVQEAQQALKAF
ncbi:tetratricopeptide repeat protein, partial [Acinetobacter baumannii]|nr:tetratricopeptide repeat protein [Acinetobacter baumannii]